MNQRPRNLFEHELAWFKANETPESVLLVDDSSLRFLVAWKQVVVVRKRCASMPAKCGKAEAWRWLWRNVEFSMEDLAGLGGASVAEATRKFAMLSGNRMVYPDWTLNTYVDNLIKARTVALFQKNQPRNPSRHASFADASKPIRNKPVIGRGHLTP